MKKILLFVLCAALVLFPALNAFARTEAEPEPELVDEDSEWLYPEDEDSDDWDGWDLPEDDGEDGDWDDDEFYDEDPDEEDLRGALEVYGWFAVAPLDVDLEKPNAAGDKWQVLDERFNTMEALRTMVEFYFSDEIAEGLLNNGVYTEENGYLYCGDGGRGIDETITETELNVTERDENKITYTLRVNYVEGSDPEYQDFTYVRELIDGEWKFTTFPFYL